jgi:hypothetical protein
MRNLQDRNIRFQTDVDTTLRDFTGSTTAVLIPYDSTAFTINIPAAAEKLDEAAKEQLRNKALLRLSFSNNGGLPMPIILNGHSKTGRKRWTAYPPRYGA